MAKNGYELRLELLQLAESRLRDRYQEAKERFQYLDERGLIADEEAIKLYPEFPTDEQIDKAANDMLSKMSSDGKI